MSLEMRLLGSQMFENFARFVFLVFIPDHNSAIILGFRYYSTIWLFRFCARPRYSYKCMHSIISFEAHVARDAELNVNRTVEALQSSCKPADTSEMALNYYPRPSHINLGLEEYYHRREFHEPMGEDREWIVVYECQGNRFCIAVVVGGKVGLTVPVEPA